MRLVLDTDVVVAGLRSASGASAFLLRAALERRVTLLASVPLVLEYEAVATRADHLAASGLSAEDVVIVIDALVSVAEPVESFFRWRPQLRDANDEMILEPVINGRADALATFNRLDFEPAIAAFGKVALLPGDICERLRT